MFVVYNGGPVVKYKHPKGCHETERAARDHALGLEAMNPGVRTAVRKMACASAPESIRTPKSKKASKRASRLVCPKTVVIGGKRRAVKSTKGACTVTLKTGRKKRVPKVRSKR